MSSTPTFDRRSFLRYSGLGALGVAGAAALAACGSSSKTSSGTTAVTTAAAGSPSTTGAAVTLNDYKMSYQLSWLKTVEFAGSYVAEKQGFYKAAGVDVDLLTGGPNTAVEPVVVQGKALVGQTGLDSCAEAISKGSDLKVVAVLLQKNPFCVVSKASNPIKTPQDLIGKKIGCNASNSPAWNAFLALNNIDASKVHTLPAQFDPTPVATGEFDGQVVFVTNEVIQLNLKGLKTATLLFEDFNYHLGTDGYVVQASTLADAKKRAAIVAFLKGELKGWQSAIADQSSAAHLTVDLYGKTTGLPYNQQLLELQAQIPLMESPLTKAHGLAYFDPSVTAPWLKTLAASKITASASMFDSSILPEVYQGKTSIP